MPIYMKYDGVDGSASITDGTSNCIMWAEKYGVQDGETTSGTRLFVGNLTMNSSDYGPEVDDQVLVSFEQLQDTHPDFLWATGWMV